MIVLLSATAGIMGIERETGEVETMDTTFLNSTGKVKYACLNQSPDSLLKKRR